jgi:EpsI family protein
MAAWLPPFALPGPELPILGAAVPETVGAWTSSRLRNDAMLLERVRFHNNVHRRYSRGAESVDFFAAAGLHRRQRSAYSPKTALPAMGHAVEERGVAQLGPNGIDVDTLLLSRRGERSLVYHWYEHTNGFASEVIRAAVALDSSPWQRDRALVVLRMSTDAGDDDADLAEAALRLERFYTELNGVTSNPTL